MRSVKATETDLTRLHPCCWLQERKTFETAFEKEEFRKMFAAYMEEISDPKARAEQEVLRWQLPYI
jgi:hypothetical protein